MTIAAKRTALAEAVATLRTVVPGWKVTDKVPDQVNPPHAVVFRNDVVYDRYLGDEHGDLLNFVVKVYVQRTTEAKGQELLDALVEPTGPTSMKVAIESNDALLALCGSAGVVGAGPVMETKVGDVSYLTVEWAVQMED